MNNSKININNMNERINSALQELGGGVLAVGYKDLSTGESFFYNEKFVFPAASIVKIPILLEYFRQMEQDLLFADEILKVTKKDVVGGAGILFELREGIELTLRELVRLMIVISDNTASNMMLDRLGMDEINALTRYLGLEDTAIGRKFMIDPKAKFSRNMTSVKDMVLLLEKLYKGEILNKENTEEALEIMSRQQYREKIPRYLPSKTRVAHKTGEITGVRHDCGIVYRENSPYVFCVLTHELPDGYRGDYVIGKLSLDFFNLKE